MRPESLTQWKILGQIDAESRTLAESLNLSPVTARLLRNRGLTEREAARRFISPSLGDFHDPLLMKDMDRAVERLERAVRKNEKILIHGDYDVDGICATAMMVRMLSALEVDVSYHIPHRVLEGYGVSSEGIQRAAQEGASLVVTVDCGITAHAEANLAKSLGLDMIITDHHQPHSDLPDALAVLNPNRPDCAYPFKGLCGCGVAFKLASALTERLGHSQERLQRAFLDLAALATIADIVPLVEENRVIAKFGLERINQTKKPGLKALIEVAGLTGKELTASHVGFQLGPRLNAAGRLDSATASIHLLLSREESEARPLAEKLNAMNRSRQEEEKATLEDACFMIESGEGVEGLEVDLDRDKAIVLASENWHVGVVGIVASRLVERYHRPTVLVALEGDRGKGSGRSIPAFHLYKALDRCRDLLLQCGGHRQAAGLSVMQTNLPAFRERFMQVAQEELSMDDLQPRLTLDCELSPEDLSFQLAHELTSLEPFGEGNPRPQFAVRGAVVVDQKAIGAQGQHLKLRVRYGASAYDCLWWRNGELLTKFEKRAPFDLCVTPEINEYQGYPSLQLVLKDAKPSNPGTARPSRSEYLVDG